MQTDTNRLFGQLVGRLIDKQDLKADEAYRAFHLVLSNEVNDMQQGAFLAALTAKGETADEVAGGWKAIDEVDTVKVELSDVVDNCGTGMDSFKTFNISTVASVIAAAGGVKLARHGARAISSSCGTVDLAESLGVDVECSADLVARSIQECGLGLFNGMSPRIHPMALGRILSQIHFGSPLNIAASLANPAMPRIALRGVYSRELILPVAEVMKAIGYERAMIVHGVIDDSELGMDEASICGTTFAAELQDGEIEEFSFEPEECGLKRHAPGPLKADSNRETAAVETVRLLSGTVDGARRDAVVLNAGLLFYLKDMAETIRGGVKKAEEVLESGKVMDTLQQWVSTQNRTPDAGLKRLKGLIAEGQC
jgi:anthranilate phosphoribosyltransferase